MRVSKIICDLCDQEVSDCKIIEMSGRPFDVCSKCEERLVAAVDILTQETITISGMNLGENLGLGIRLEKGMSLEALNLLLGKNSLGTPPQIKL